jgi:hypothetical protein
MLKAPDNRAPNDDDERIRERLPMRFHEARRAIMS